MVLPRYQRKVAAVKGVAQARQALAVLIEATERVTQPALNEMGSKMVDAASSRTPIDTGRLVSNNKILKTTDRSITVGNPTPYAGFVEHGTKKQAAQPFWTPVIELMAGEFPTVFLKGVKRYMDERLGYSTTADR